MPETDPSILPTQPTPSAATMPMAAPAPLDTPPGTRRRPLWLRLIFLVVRVGFAGVLTLGGIVLAATLLFQQPAFQMWFMSQSQGRNFGDAREPAQHVATPYPRPEPDLDSVRSAADFFSPTNFWPIHLQFTRAEFEALGPRRVEPFHGWLRKDGAPILNNPNAARAGLAGVFGFDQPWSTGRVEVAGHVLTNVAIRYKGNGTFVSSLRHYKRPFKLDLDEHVKGRRVAGQSTLNLHNLTSDPSYIADSLAYEFYREARVPAPRTTFARVTLGIEGRWDRRPLGLYAIIENPDANWAKANFTGKGVAIYKPVTLELFADLGDAWAPYEQVYRAKATPSPDQRRRLIELARLVSHSPDDEFRRRLGDFLDLDEVARFFACEALLTNLDGILSNGQNFYLWHDPATDRFGFSPWDLDHCWGEFPWVGSKTAREQADLFHPWVGKNHFLERLYAHPDFAARYRRELGHLLDSQFLPTRLSSRIDDLANLVRPAIAEESTRRLERFEQALFPSTNTPPKHAGGGWDDDDSRPVHDLKAFIAARARHARAQLEGRETGVRLKRSR